MCSFYYIFYYIWRGTLVFPRKKTSFPKRQDKKYAHNHNADILHNTNPFAQKKIAFVIQNIL